MTARGLVPHELLGTAYQLAGAGTGLGRPRSADLRRAVSTAYYALFHALTWTVATELLGDPHDVQVPTVRRWITHTDLHGVATTVLVKAGQERRLGKGGKPMLQALPDCLDERLVTLAETFVALQEQRHSADYDDRYDINKEEALGLVRNAEEAVTSLWQLHAEREPATVRLVRLALGAAHIAKERSP